MASNESSTDIDVIKPVPSTSTDIVFHEGGTRLRFKRNSYDVQSKSHDWATSYDLENHPNNQQPDENCDSDEEYNCCLNKLALAVQNFLNKFYQKYKTHLKRGAFILLLLLYCCYLGAAIYHSVEGAKALLVITGLAVVGIVLYLVHHYTGQVRAKLKQKWQASRGPTVIWYAIRIFMLLLAVGIAIFVCVDTRNRPTNLISAVGLVVFNLIGFCFSTSPALIPWRTVMSALLAQFLLGFTIIRWEKGFAAFEWTAEQVTKFLFFTDYGSRFVFGELFERHGFVFQAMPIVFYFGGWISLLYFWGVLQKVITAVGYVIQKILNIGPLEAFISVASIFLDPNAASMTIAAFLPDMTLSELHCIMTSGFSTVAGSLFGAYLASGISASALMAASVMSAPAALGTAKLFYPEAEKSKFSSTAAVVFPKSSSRSAMEAFSDGALEGFVIVVHVVVNLLGFVAALAFIDATLFWFGARVGIPGLSFAVIASYVFYPAAFIMGVDIADCRQVARLLGTKYFLTEIVGYSELGILINNRKMGLSPSVSERSEIIATYALCGFSSFPDIAINLAALGSLAPSRKSDLARVALRAMVAGNFACYMSACVAGLLYTVS